MAAILPSYHKAGTATVAANGLVVTGQNTLWRASILPGDLFGVHRGLSIPIGSVDSDTSLTLAYNWPGAAQATAAYAIGLQSDVSRYSEALRQLLEKLSSGNVDALAGLVGAINKMPIFTGAGTMDVADLSALAKTLLAKTTEAQMRSTLAAVSQGSGANMNNNVVHLGWDQTGAAVRAQVDASPQGKVWTDAFVGLAPASRRAELGAQTALGYTPVRQGGGTGQGSNVIKIGWATTGGDLLAEVDALNLGRVWNDYACQSVQSQSGYQRFASGVMIQWGMQTGGASDLQLNFPYAFAATPWIVVGNPFGEMPGAEAWTVTFGQYTAGTFVMRRRVAKNGGVVDASNSFVCPWLAIGKWF